MNLTVLVEHLSLETFFIFKLGTAKFKLSHGRYPGRPEVLAELGYSQIQGRPLIKGAVMLAILRSLKICTRLLHDARIQDVAPI